MTDTLHEAIFECECHCEQVIASQWEDDGDEMYLCMWSRGKRSGRGLWNLRSRLRFAWRSLRKGDPYVDEVILNRADAARLGAWLVESAHRGKTGPNYDTNTTTRWESSA